MLNKLKQVYQLVKESWQEQHEIYFRDEYVWPLLKHYGEEMEQNDGKLQTVSKKNYHELERYARSNFNMIELTKKVMKQMVKLSKHEIPATNKTEGITLITSFYDIQEPERRDEIVESIQR